VPEHEFTITFQVLAERNPCAGLPQQAGEGSLAGFEGFAPQVLPIKRQQVERIEERDVIVLARAQPLER
jgi:hypothetical protein